MDVNTHHQDGVTKRLPAEPTDPPVRITQQYYLWSSTYPAARCPNSTPTRSGLVRLARLVGDSCSNGVLAEGLLQFFSFHYSLPPHGGPLRTTFLPGSLLSACQHKATKSSAFLLNGGWLEYFRGDKHLFSASCSVFLPFFPFFSFNGIISDSCHSREAYCLPATTILVY
jgi:hypothetical protein